MININRVFFLIFLLFILPSCTTIEVAANLGKKVIPLIDKEEKTKTSPVYKVGTPYVIDGRTYYPKKNLNYDKTGVASWYGPKFHGKLTANGEIFNQYKMTAAHKTLPIPSLVQVTNLKNGKSILVRINDRGPFVNDRIIDLSSKAADVLSLKNSGTGLVRVKLMRSESILLEKLAKRGQFPEVDELKKMVNPPIKKPSNINVKVLNINENNKNNKHDKKKYAILKKIKTLEINEKKFKIWIQIAAFKNMKSAKILKNKFKSLEKININKAFVNGNIFYRVRVGPFKKIEEADKIFNFLIQEGMEGTKIVIN